MKPCSRCKVDNTTTPIYFDNFLVGQLCKECFLRWLDKLDDIKEDTTKLEWIEEDQQ